MPGEVSDSDRCLGTTRSGGRCRRRAKDGGFCVQHVPETASGAVSEAVKQSRIDGLVALRDRLAEEIDADPEPRDLAALSSRLEKVLEQIDGLKEFDGDGDEVDELRRKRAERVARAGSESR